MAKKEMTGAEKRAGYRRIGGRVLHPTLPAPASQSKHAASATNPKAFSLADSAELGMAEVDRKTFEGLHGINKTPRHELPVTPSLTNGPTPAPLD